MEYRTQRFLVQKDGHPAIKRRGYDTKDFIDPFYGLQVQKISPQYKQDKAQGIGSVRNQTGWMGSMGVPAEIAAEPLNRDVVDHRPIFLHFKEIPCIMGKRAQTAACPTRGAGFRRQALPPTPAQTTVDQKNGYDSACQKWKTDVS